MKTQRLLILGLGLVCAAGMLGGCTNFISDEDPAALIIIGNVVPKNEGNVCTLKEAEFYYSMGEVDFAVTDEFVFNAEIQNVLPESQAVSGNGPAELRPETNVVTIQRAVVSFDPGVPPPYKNTPFASSAPGNLRKNVQLSWEVPLQVTLLPGGKAIVPFLAIPRKGKVEGATATVDIGSDWRARFGGAAATTRYTNKIQGTLSIQLEGVTASGSTVRPPAYVYPVTLCFGCLLFPASFDPTDDTAEGVWKSCSSLAVPTTYTSPCVPGQQEPVHCALGCQMCKTAESLGAAKCDALFCPPLQ